MFGTTQRHKLDTVSTLQEFPLPSKGTDESVKSLVHEKSAMVGEQRQRWNLRAGQGGLHGGTMQENFVLRVMGNHACMIPRVGDSLPRFEERRQKQGGIRGLLRRGDQHWAQSLHLHTE